MIVMEYNQIEIDYCTSCKGVWFDGVELDLLMKSLNISERNLLLENLLKSPDVKSADLTRKCPICGRHMKLTNVGKEKEIIIDVCKKGDGLWFDGGELNQLIQQEIAGRQNASDQSTAVYDFLADVFKAENK